MEITRIKNKIFLQDLEQIKIPLFQVSVYIEEAQAFVQIQCRNGEHDR